LEATVSPSNATNKNVTWSSSNPEIATVDETTGLVTGVAIGTTTIIATSVSGNKTATTRVEVVDQLSNYYWYAGATLPTTLPTSISNIQTDNTKPGWHEIGISLSGFSITFNNANLIEFDSTIQYYVIIPNNLHIYAADGNTIVEETYYNPIECNIPGYKVFQFKRAVWDVKGIIIR
jgi:hypothetical protein